MNYITKLYVDNLVWPMGEVPSEKDVEVNVFDALSLKSMKADSYLNEVLRKNLKNVKNNIEVIEKNYDEDSDDYGLSIKVEINLEFENKLSERDLEDLQEYYVNIGENCYWSSFFDDIEFRQKD